VTQYTFILRETAAGSAHHGQKNQRRQAALDYANLKNCQLLSEPQDMKVNGVWHYWWWLDIPDQQTLDDIIKQYTVTNQYVEFAVPPTKPL